MSRFTVEESNLMCIYGIQTRQGLIDDLTEMQTPLQSDEAELKELANSVIAKLSAMSDEEFESLSGELIPDFEEQED